ncbi:MAG: crotonase/enoyl-CoA hydratase family protein [Actinophytocola sp.]|nr:crotonase/enoyl-CoA hydratase family protein [Actinophytocola sp.]
MIHGKLRTGLNVARAMLSFAVSRRSDGDRAAETPAAVPPPREFAYQASASVSIPASPEQVFAVVGEAGRLADWLIMHVGWPDGEPGELRKGATFRQQLKLMGMPAQVRWSVSAAEPPRLVWLDAEGPMGTSIGCYFSVSATAEGSTVRFDGGIEGDSIKGPMGPLVARNLGDAMHKSLAKLAELVTQHGSAAPAPSTKTTPKQSPRRRPAKPPRTKPAPVRHERTGTDLDPWTPVIVGVGQVVDRDTGVTDGHDPVSLAADALRRAGQDSGAGDALLAQADSVRYVASVSWSYADGAALIAEALGAQPRETVQTTAFGGDGSQRLINDTAQSIADGLVDVALLGGAEAAATATAAERRGATPAWPQQPAGTQPTKTLGVDHGPGNAAENAAGLVAPIYLYSLLENAIRGKRKADPASHLRHITRLWSQFSEVAADNPYAWLPRATEPTELATPTEDNRPISAPYPKLLTANLQVNQATGLIMCSAAAAQAAGVPQDNWVFVHAGAHAQEEWYVSARADLAAVPAIEAIGTAALDHAGIGIDDVAHIDLYACFPSAVQLAADALGLPVGDPARPLTVTGGLTFAGGPGNNYTSHAVANLVSRLRAEPETYGLATAVGWYMTKHAIGIYSAQPPRLAFRQIDAGLRMQRPPARRVLTDYTGPAVVDAYTVPYTRDREPEAAIVSALTPDGARVLLRSKDPEIVSAVLGGDPLGWQVTVTAPDGLTVDSTTPAALPPVGEPPLLVEWHGPVTMLRLNRPRSRNAIDLATAQALAKAIDAFEADDEARVAILTGAGGTFCSGMDLKAAAGGEFPITEDRGPLGVTAKPPVKPLIAAVEGHALAGGCELALAADLIVAADDARFGLPEPKRGLIAAAGGVLRFAQRLPRSTAMELALTGAPVTAQRLYDLGLVNRITEPGGTVDAAMDLARQIASNAPLSVELSKQIIDECPDWSTEEAFERQSDIASDALYSADAEEGIRAFAEGREPRWRGY